ncbi:hypothetical protein [Flavobacterium rhizosphaerae]|uniref:Lipoprotein n=1 Tax=Flavobacterium rhizosphaerae TaxID=3163298 RepID=A0ABW8YWR7_9FLAO
MRKTLLVKAFVALFFISLASCDTEPVDPVLNDYDDSAENPGEGSSDVDDNDGDSGSSEGDYWPMAINNEWVFESTAQENVQPMKIIGTEVIGGKTYYRVDDYFSVAGTDEYTEFTGTTTVYLRKEGGSYYQRISVSVPDAEGMSTTVTPYEYICFKDNLEVNEGWTDTATQTSTYTMDGGDFDFPAIEIDLNLSFQGVILEKGITLTVNGVTYQNVIKEKLIQTITMQGMSAGSITTYIWFAKDVGPIKSETNEDSYDATVTLTSYTLN